MDLETLLKGDLSKHVVVAVFTQAGLALVLAYLGLLPWATEKEMTELKARDLVDVRQLDERRDLFMSLIETNAKNIEGLVQLKNMDNQWYRELKSDVERVKVDVGHIKQDTIEIKDDIRALAKGAP